MIMSYQWVRSQQVCEGLGCFYTFALPREASEALVCIRLSSLDRIGGKTMNWRNLMPTIPSDIRLKLPFVMAGFASFLFSVWLYFVQDETMAGIFVGLWVPSIHSLGTLLLAPTTGSDAQKVMS